MYASSSGPDPGPTVIRGSSFVRPLKTAAEVVVFPTPISPKENRLIPDSA